MPQLQKDVLRLSYVRDPHWNIPAGDAAVTLARVAACNPLIRGWFDEFEGALRLTLADTNPSPGSVQAT
jgi:hypothetical protein